MRGRTHLGRTGRALRPLLEGIAIAAMVCGCVLFARAQDQGPIAAPPKFEVNRIPAVPHPGPPPIPVEQIIQKFAANEDAMKKALDAYDYMQTVRVEELDDSNDDGGSLSAARWCRVCVTVTFGGVKGQLEFVATLTTMRLSLEEVRQMINLPGLLPDQR